MPVPRWVARANRYVANPIIGRLAPRVPFLGLIIHTGRRSGRQYRIPVNVFRTNGGYVIALTYGAESDWVRNVLAAGGCQMVHRGRTITLTDPRLIHDEQRRPVPAPIRLALGALKVYDFLEMREA